MNPVEYYATPGTITDLTEWTGDMSSLPDDPVAVAEMVQGLVVHPFWAGAYDVELTPDRFEELGRRAASRILDRVVDLDDRPLTEPRPPERRVLGNCRDFSVLTVAILRRAGVASRARCGFAGYFDRPKWVDHWIVEHWDGVRWVRLDAQLDELQQEVTGVSVPHDLAPGQFLTGGDAWQRYRRGELAGGLFGILDEWGPWMAAGNLGRDLAALDKIEMLPWDDWGRIGDAGSHPDGDEWFDDVAALTVSDDLDAIVERYRDDPDLRMPGQVTAYFPDPHEVDVSELL